MKKWSDLIDFVAPYVDDVPDAMTEQALKWATIRLCERSGILKREIFIDAQKCVGDYPLDLDDCYRPHSIYTLCVNGHDYSPQSSDLCCNNSCSKVYFMHDPTWLNIRPLPIRDEQDGIRIVLSVKPSVDSCDVDDLLYEEFSEALTAGTLARLYKMMRRPWSNLNLAKEYEREFSGWMAKAQIRAYKGFTRGPIRLKARPFVPADRSGVFVSGVR